MPIALFFIALIAYGNLRGVKESGKVFAVPTYFFIVNMFVLLGLGVWLYVNGDLPFVGEFVEGNVHQTEFNADALFYGAGLFGVLHAFASGGAAVTGVEAISNGVPAFKEPAWKNARQTLVIMGTGLGIMFLGLSMLAAEIEVIPFEGGTPTVISQVGEQIYGQSALGQVLYYSLQAGTMLILVMAANTGFADFPRLASFQAGDSFLPRQMTKRGHRLVYSNGILVLAGVAGVLVIATGAEVTALIPLYAIGVFTGFTLSQAGMTKHHLRLREPGWRKGVAINGFGCFLSFVVAAVIAVTKFADGAWVILITLPVMVVLLLRLNRQYTREAHELDSDVPAAIKAPILRRHVVLVFMDRLDMATARAIQYARSLTPDELRVVHFAVDDQVAHELAEEWRRLGLTRVPLDIVGCPDRRLTRAAVQVRGARAGRRRDRGERAAARPQVPGRVAPGAARPHRRGLPRRPVPAAARQRHHRARSSSTAARRRSPGGCSARRCGRWPATAAGRCSSRPRAAPAARRGVPDHRGAVARPGPRRRRGAIGPDRVPARLAHPRARAGRRHRRPVDRVPRPPADRRRRRRHPPRGQRHRRGVPEPPGDAQPHLPAPMSRAAAQR